MERGWKTIDSAPKDGTVIRCCILSKSANGIAHRELPFLVRFHEGRWCYARTNVRVYSWHEPVKWNDAPRLAKEQDWFDAQIRALDSARPLLRVVNSTSIAGASQ